MDLHSQNTGVWHLQITVSQNENQTDWNMTELLFLKSDKKYFLLQMAHLESLELELLFWIVN